MDVRYKHHFSDVIVLPTILGALLVSSIVFVHAQTEQLRTTQVKCISGQGPQELPQEKCWSGESEDAQTVTEEGKNLRTHNRVIVDANGRMTVCSIPVPLDVNCKPTETGTVTYCDFLKGYMTCNHLPKDTGEGARIANSLGDMAQKSLDPFLQNEISEQSAASMKEIARQTLRDSYGSPIADPYCVIVPCGGEQLPGPEGNRFVTLPDYEAERIANSAGFSERFDAWADLQWLSGSGFESSPIQRTTGDLVDLDLAERYTLDTGGEVRLYSQSPQYKQAPITNFATYEYGSLPSGDGTFIAPAPVVPIQPAEPYGSFFTNISWPSWMTSAGQKVRGWFGI